MIRKSRNITSYRLATFVDFHKAFSHESELSNAFLFIWNITNDKTNYKFANITLFSFQTPLLLSKLSNVNFTNDQSWNLIKEFFNCWIWSYLWICRLEKTLYYFQIDIIARNSDLISVATRLNCPAINPRIFSEKVDCRSTATFSSVSGDG